MKLEKFDEKAALEAAEKLPGSIDYYYDCGTFVEGARWQHQQMAPQLGAKDSRIAELEGALDIVIGICAGVINSPKASNDAFEIAEQVTDFLDKFLGKSL